MSTSRTDIKKTTIMMTIIVVVVKVFGLLRDLVLANVYQTSAISDAFIIAFSIPSVLFSVLGKSIATAYIPVFLQIEKDISQKEAEKYTTKICIYGTIICAIILSIFLIFPRQIISLFASGFDENTITICLDILKIGIFSIFFMLLTSVFTHYLQNKKMYILTAIISFPLNLILIASIFISKQTNYLVLGYGILLAFASEFILLIPFIFKKGYKVRFGIKPDKYIGKTCLLIGPILIGSCASQINHTLDKSIASKYGTGGVSILSYASTINVAIQELLITSLLSVVFIEFSKLFVEEKIDEIKEKTQSITRTITAVLIPVSLIVCIFNKEIVRVLFFANKNIDDATIETIGKCLVFYSIGILFVALRDLYIKIFYARQNTLIPTINSVVSIGLNIGLNYLFFHLIGIEGIALATSISAIFAFVTLALSFRKKYFSISNSGGLRKIIIVILNSFMSIILAKKVFDLLLQSCNFYFSLIFAIALACLIYYISCKIFGIEEISTFFKSFGRKRVNKNGD